MSVSCQLCGQTWPRDPRLEVPCPQCHAQVGRRCRRPSEYAGGNFIGIHIPREQLAVDRGFLSQHCPASKSKPMKKKTTKKIRKPIRPLRRLRPAKAKQKPARKPKDLCAQIPKKKYFKPSKAAKKFARNLKPIHPFPARMAPEIAFDALPTAKPERPLTAYCWESGLIEFGPRTPEGAIHLHTGEPKKLRAVVETLARWSYPTKSGGKDSKPLVPGVPERDDTGKLEAVYAFIAQIKQRFEPKPAPVVPDPHYIAGHGLPLFERYDFVKQKRIRATARR